MRSARTSSSRASEPAIQGSEHGSAEFSAACRFVVGVAVEHGRGHPQPQPPAVLAERAARQHPHAVLVQQHRRQALVAGDAVPREQHVGQRGEVRVEVEGRLRRGHLGAGPGEPVRHRPGHRPVQAAAERDPFGQLRRLAEGQCGSLLHRPGRGGPDLAADAEQPVAQVAPEPSGGQPGHAEAPAPEGEVLAQAGGDHRPFGTDDGGTGERRVRIVDQVPVDLVRDDHQVVRLGHRTEVPDGRGRGQPAGRVVGERHYDRTDRVARRPRRRHRPGEVVRVRDSARTRHEVCRPAGQGGLRGVADPAGPGHGDAGPWTADGGHQAEQQGLAARPADHRVRVGGQAAPGPVAGRRRAQRGVPGDRAVGVAPGGAGQRGAQRPVRGQARLAEGQRQHRLAAAAPCVQGLVGGERGGDRDAGRAQPGMAGIGVGKGTGWVGKGTGWVGKRTALTGA